VYERVSEWARSRSGVVNYPRVRAMTASPRASNEQPGINVHQNARLNRSIPDTSWGQLRTTLERYGRPTGGGHCCIPRNTRRNSRQTRNRPSNGTGSTVTCSSANGPLVSGIWTLR
jgi:hypothetical protein